MAKPKHPIKDAAVTAIQQYEAHSDEIYDHLRREVDQEHEIHKNGVQVGRGNNTLFIAVENYKTAISAAKAIKIITEKSLGEVYSEDIVDLLNIGDLVHSDHRQQGTAYNALLSFSKAYEKELLEAAVKNVGDEIRRDGQTRKAAMEAQERIKQRINHYERRAYEHGIGRRRS